MMLDKIALGGLVKFVGVNITQLTKKLNKHTEHLFQKFAGWRSRVDVIVNVTH